MVGQSWIYTFNLYSLKLSIFHSYIETSGFTSIFYYLCGLLPRMSTLFSEGRSSPLWSLFKDISTDCSSPWSIHKQLIICRKAQGSLGFLTDVRNTETKKGIQKKHECGHISTFMTANTIRIVSSWFVVWRCQRYPDGCLIHLNSPITNNHHNGGIFIPIWSLQDGLGHSGGVQ